jgi:hypothetical protein
LASADGTDNLISAAPEGAAAPVTAEGGLAVVDMAEVDIAEVERDALARSILEHVLDRIVAWDTRTRSTSSASGKWQPPATGVAALSSANALSYNPYLVPNCSGAPPVAATATRLLSQRFRHAVSLMDPVEIDHYYVLDTPQVVSHTKIQLDGEVHVPAYQVRVALQQTGSRCGHHAFHNALSVARAISAPTEVEALQALADTQSEPAFWSRFNQSLASLRKEAERRGTDSWPWNHNFVDGEVERSHMTHLLRTDEVGRLGGDDTFILFQYAMGQPMLDTESLLACQKAADNFVASPGPCHRCVIVGALSHWVNVVINKVPTGGGATAMEVLLFDSNNTPVLGANETELAEIAAAKAEERGWDPTSSKESYYRSSLRDRQAVVTLLARLFSGATDIRAEAVNGAVERMLSDFDLMVKATTQGTTHARGRSSASQQTLSSEERESKGWHQWLRERQPPAVLRSGVLATVQRWGSFLSDLNRKALRAWAEQALLFSHRHGGNTVLSGEAQASARSQTAIELAHVAEATLSVL